MRKEDIKISVIIPCYNTAEFIKRCLDSVIVQDIGNIEIICIDDGSTDNTLQILEEYDKKYDIVTVMTQQRKCAGIARNNGLRVAKGEYVHFLDADDYVLPDSYKKIYDDARFYDADFIKARCFAFDMKSHEVINVEAYNLELISGADFGKALNIIDNTYAIIHTNVTPWGGLYKKDFLVSNHLNFDGLMYCNDLLFYAMAMCRTDKIFFVDTYMVAHQINNPCGLTGNMDLRWECMLQCYENILTEAVKMDSSHRSILFDWVFKGFDWDSLIKKLGNEKIYEYFCKFNFSKLDKSLLCNANVHALIDITGKDYWKIVDQTVNVISEKQALLNLFEENKVIIYGAGKMANRVLSFLKNTDRGIENVVSILVSDLDHNPQKIGKIEVQEMNTKIPIENIVLICTLNKNQPEIYCKLHQKGIKRITVLDENIDL